MMLPAGGLNSGRKFNVTPGTSLLKRESRQLLLTLDELVARFGFNTMIGNCKSVELERGKRLKKLIFPAGYRKGELD